MHCTKCAPCIVQNVHHALYRTYTMHCTERTPCIVQNVHHALYRTYRTHCMHKVHHEFAIIVSEEILRSNVAHWLSADSRYVAYIQFNDTSVPLQTYPVFGDPTNIYGGMQAISYPKVRDIMWLYDHLIHSFYPFHISENLWAKEVFLLLHWSTTPSLLIPEIVIVDVSGEWQWSWTYTS